MAAHDTKEPCASEEELKHHLSQLLSIPANIETATNCLYENLVEDILLGVVFEMHYLNRLGGVPVMSEEEMKQFAIVESSETDIFGQQYVKKSQDCCCPSCNRPLSASRFAPHLEKCLGMGRNSSRIASRRIANNCKENAYGGMSDDDDDDWVAGQEKSKISKRVDGKKRRDKNGVRRTKSQKVATEKNISGKVCEEYSQNAKYDNVESKN